MSPVYSVKCHNISTLVSSFETGLILITKEKYPFISISVLFTISDNCQFIAIVLL